MSIAALGVLMRTNPLPAGRYWLDVFGDNRDKMSTWLKTNAASLQVEDTESFEATTDFPARDFYIFSVKSPAPWDAVTFGYPTVADSSVKSSNDTVQKPQVESSTQILQSAADTVTKIAFWSAVAIAGVLVLKTADTLGVFRPTR
jgi:hypothetical protein